MFLSVLREHFVVSRIIFELFQKTSILQACIFSLNIFTYSYVQALDTDKILIF